MKLPRHWKAVIGGITGLHFCDQDCGCGENNQLWWFPPGSMSRALPEFVQSWMNGSDTQELWQWLVENGHVDQEAGTHVGSGDAYAERIPGGKSMKCSPEYAKELEKLARERGGRIGNTMPLEVFMAKEAGKRAEAEYLAKVHVLEIPDYLPPSLNRLMTSVGGRIRLKKECTAMVAAYGHKIPRATSRRLVHITLSRTGRRKEMDADNAVKAILDALVVCRILVDDSPKWCKVEDPVQVKGEKTFTRIELEDM